MVSKNALEISLCRINLFNVSNKYLTKNPNHYFRNSNFQFSPMVHLPVLQFLFLLLFSSSLTEGLEETMAIISFGY